MTYAITKSHPTTLLPAAFQTLDRFPRAALDLMFRVGIGMVFWKSGMAKLGGWEFTIQLFQDEYMVPLLPPETAALLATTAELTLPVLLFLGFATRFAALGLLGMVAVIQVFVYPENWSEHLLWASVLTYLLTRGAGPVSVDRLVAHRFFRA